VLGRAGGGIRALPSIVVVIVLVVRKRRMQPQREHKEYKWLRSASYIDLY
jgi:hypothetical protein